MKRQRNISFLYLWVFTIIIGLSVCVPHHLSAQKFIDPREAEGYYKDKNYIEALKGFKDLLKENPNDVDYHYKIGICYLNTHIDKAEAVQYFEWIVKQPKFDNDVWYELGKAYHYANKFTEAIKALNTYKEHASDADKLKADKEIQECNNAIQLVKYPLNVTFENLGKVINSPYADYYPFVNEDESMLIFTTRRPGMGFSQQPEIDGYYSSDVYISHAVNGIWQKPKSIGSQINTPDDEEAVGLNPSASELVLYFDHVDVFGDIYYSERHGNTFSRAVPYNDAINAGLETSGSVSPDGNVLFFASSRAGGYGETDIYMSKKLPDGHWATPQNLGRNINTPYKEDFPWLDIDGTTLYFSSQGHSTMGDFDLFKAQWLDVDSNSWSPPQNLGFPVNTSDDDRCISFTADHRVAYISRVRPGGYGDFDIYRIVFNDKQRYAIVRGRIITGDSTKPIEAEITAMNSKDPDAPELDFKSTKSGHYVMALLPGIYNITVQCDGYPSLKDKIVILGLSSFNPETVKDYSLIPPTPPPANNDKKKLKPAPTHRVH